METLSEKCTADHTLNVLILIYNGTMCMWSLLRSVNPFCKDKFYTDCALRTCRSLAFYCPLLKCDKAYVCVCTVSKASHELYLMDFDEFPRIQ